MLTAGGPARSSDFIPTYNIDGWSDTREQVLLRRDQRLGVDKKQAVLKMLAEVRVAAAPAERALCCVRPNVFIGGGTVCNGLDPAAPSHARGRLRALRGAAVVLCTAPPRAGAAWEGHRARGMWAGAGVAARDLQEAVQDDPRHWAGGGGRGGRRAACGRSSSRAQDAVAVGVGSARAIGWGLQGRVESGWWGARNQASVVKGSASKGNADASRPVVQRGYWWVRETAQL
jgi:hypothetical protein